MLGTASIIIPIAIALFLFILLAGMNIFLYLQYKKSTTPIEEHPEPPQEQRTEPRPDTGWPPGSIGDLSSRIGYDVREVLMAGFTLQEVYDYPKEEILAVMHGEYSLKELRKRKK
jgi:hypothetical protein